MKILKMYNAMLTCHSEAEAALEEEENEKHNTMA